jgi:hypothetical protein
LKRIPSLIGSSLAALVLAGAAYGGLTVGVSEDRGKQSDAMGFFNTMQDLGMTENRVSIIWDPSQPTTIPERGSIQSWLPLAQKSSVRIVFAVTARHARDLTTSPGASAKFATFLGQLAQAFPQVKDYVIGNEPNQPYFWLPQFGTAGQPLSAAAYEPVLAQAYDALKAVDPTINVIGIGLSPRGNDNPNAKNNRSRSPVRFLHELGDAYRASGRAKPLMDQLAFHPYPRSNDDPPSVGYAWPNAGIPNLDRIKQAVWDAFHGTAQPTFAETGARRSFASAPPLTFDLDEIGWQVAIPPTLTNLYFGVEDQPTIDEATQALYYTQSITDAECDPTVRSLSFFLLMDEPDLKHWQSGLERLDGSHRPSYDAVKQTMAQTHGVCQGPRVTWTHSNRVVAPLTSWGVLRRYKANRRRWSFRAGAGEEALFHAGVFKARTKQRAIARRLATGRPKPFLAASGMIKAKSRVVSFPARRLKPGRYVFAIRMQATMNPARVTLLVSRPFVVGARRR